MYASVLHDVLRRLVDQAKLECMSFHPLLVISIFFFFFFFLIFREIRVCMGARARAYAERYFDAFFQDVLEIASLLALLALCPRINKSCKKKVTRPH